MNVWNQSGNAGNRIVIEKTKSIKMFNKRYFLFFAEIEKQNEIRIVIKR